MEIIKKTAWIVLDGMELIKLPQGLRQGNYLY